MIFGLNATKTTVVIAETKGASVSFVITAIQPILFQVRSGDDLAELLQTLITLFGRKGKGTGSFIALFRCSSGRFGSCLEAIKGEAMIELAACQRGLRVVKIAPQSLKKALGSAKDQKWQHRAGELFNPDGKRPNWSKGAAGAVAAAFKPERCSRNGERTRPRVQPTAPSPSAGGVRITGPFGLALASGFGARARRTAAGATALPSLLSASSRLRRRARDQDWGGNVGLAPGDGSLHYIRGFPAHSRTARPSW